MKKTVRCFSIGDIVLSLSWDPRTFSPFLDPALETFSVDSRNCRKSVIAFHVTEKGDTDLRSYREIFTVLPGGLWKVWQKNRGRAFLISLHDTLNNNEPYRFAATDASFTRFEIFHADNMQTRFNPVEYPLDQVAVAGHLTLNRIGMLLHSAMVCIGGNGYLFSGTSGSGKSTLSELWLADEEAEVLTDERVIIREKGGSIRAYGTPWHGTSAIHKNKGAPVRKIFFLGHGPENRLRKIRRADAANRLMVRCFPPFWHKAGMGFTLDFCAKVATAVESYEFLFVPDRTAVSFLRKNIGRKG